MWLGAAVIEDDKIGVELPSLSKFPNCIQHDAPVG
jgi:hypothetical protein